MARCNCSNINPCECKPSAPCKVDPCKDCIRVASPVLYPDDSVGPCGQTGFINLKPLNNYSICGENGQVFHKIVSYDTTAFSNVYFDTTNGQVKVYFTTTEAAIPEKYYTIKYKAVCVENGLGDFGEIKIYIKNECKYKECNNCDPCTGECLEGSDLSVQIGSGDLSVKID